jgi:multidrug transporter EmrE-like cation transporter
MSTLGFVLVLASAFCQAIANLMLRKGTLAVGVTASPAAQIQMLVRRPDFVTGVMMYGLAALIWFRVLPVENLTTSYPVLVGLTFILVTIGAVLMFHEHVNPPKVAGMILIVAGIVLASRA